MTFKTQNTNASSKFLWCFNPNNAGLHFSFIFTFNFHVLSIFLCFSLFDVPDVRMPRPSVEILNYNYFSNSMLIDFSYGYDLVSLTF